MPTEREIEEFDKRDPYLIMKRKLPDGRCLRLHSAIGCMRLTIAQTPGDDSFDLVYDFAPGVPEYPALPYSIAAALTWDGTGEPYGYLRRFPPLGEDEDTLPGCSL